MDIGDVTVDFEANAADFIANMEAMIESVKGLQDAVDQATVSIETMHAALDDLPTDHITNVTLVGEDEILEQVAEIREYVDALPDERVIRIVTETSQEGNAGDPEEAQAAADAINDLTDSLDRNADAWARVEDVGRDYSAMMGETIADANEASGALDRVFAVSSDGVADMKSATEATQNFNDALERLPDYTTDLETSIKETGDAADLLGQSIQDNLNQGMLKAFQTTQTLDNGLEKLKTATNDAGTAADDTTWAWLSLTHNIQTFGGALQMVFGRDIPLVTSIAGWHLLLDGIAESVIALSGAFIALGSAAAGLAPSFLDIYNHLKAVRDTIEAFGVETAPFTSFFLNLQHAMQTQAIELYGEALLDLGKANSSVADSIENVGEAIDRMGAKISEWIGSNTDFAATIQKGGEYAKDLGDILGNLIVIIDELIRADSGIVGFVLDFFNGFTHAISAVLGFSSALDKLLLVTHGILLWGGLLSSMLLNLALMFLRPVANIAAFVGGVQSASAAIKDFEVANDAAATPIQKLGIVFQTMGSAVGNIVTTVGGGIKSWAAGVGEDMGAAEGLVATAGAGIKSVFSSIGSGLLALATSPWTWAITAAASLAYLGYEFSQVDSSATTFLSNWNSITSNDSASKFLVDSGTEISQIYGTQIPASLKAASAGMAPFYNAFHAASSDIGQANISTASGFEAIGKAVENAGKAAIDYIPDLIVGQKAENSVTAYQQAISSLSSSQQTMFKVAGTVMKDNSTGFAQALGLMDAAGIKSGESFKEDMTQVDGLIAGYKALGESGSDLQNSIDAVTLSTELQESEISQITQGWSAFINLVTGGESSFVTVAQQVAGTLSAAGGAASTLAVSNGKVTSSIKDASGAAAGAVVNIDSLSTAGLSLKSTFIQTIQSMSGSINSMLQLSSAGGQGAKGISEVDQAGKDYVASLLPMAKGSQDATTMLYALAQQAGYTGADSFKSLAQWVGNIKNPMQQAENIMNGLTQAAGNLATDVTNLANAINTNLDTAMASAIAGGSGVQTAFNNLYTALHASSDIMSGAVQTAATHLASSLLNDLGGNVNAAKQDFETFYIMMGYSKQEADAMWASVEKLAAEESILATTTGGLSGELSDIITSAGGASAKFDTLKNALLGNVNEIIASGATRQQLITDLEHAGIQAQEAAKLVNDLEIAIQGLTSKTVTITTEMITTGQTPITGINNSALPAPHAAGYRVPGYGGGDIHPALLEGGEAVVPKELVGPIAPYLKAHGVPGFASGGIVGGMTSSQLAALQGAEEQAALAVTAAQATFQDAVKAVAQAQAMESAARAHDIHVNREANDTARMVSADKMVVAHLRGEKASKEQQVALASAQAMLSSTMGREAQFQMALKAAGQVRSLADAALTQKQMMEAVAAAQLHQKQELQASAESALTSAAAQMRQVTGQAQGAIPTGWYDEGGFLQPGWTLALNTTGRPEPVGAATGAGPAQPLHVHVNLDGREMATAIVPDLVGAVGRYGTRNSGKTTGLLKPS